MDSSFMNELSTIFTGKGGTIRTAIVGIIVLGVVGSVIESNYELEGHTKDGKGVTLKPSRFIPLGSKIYQDDTDHNNLASTPSPAETAEENVIIENM